MEKIVVQDLCKSYGLLGPNGAGKTTAMSPSGARGCLKYP